MRDGRQMEKLKIMISGIGNRALPKKPEGSNWLGWLELIRRSEQFDLVAAHDISEDARKRIVERGYLTEAQTYGNLDQMIEAVQCDAIMVSNPAEYHADTIVRAIQKGIHILVEKPFVNDLQEGKRLVEAIEQKGIVAAVVQNWRSKSVGIALRDAIESGVTGSVGHVLFRYIRNRENPHYPPYIFEEPYPLLYAMGIHHLDLFRYLLHEEYESVSGHSFKPPWSLYKSDTGVSLFLKTKSGVPIMYSGSVSSMNSVLPQESLVIEGAEGTLFNESHWMEPPLWFCPKGKKERVLLTKESEDASVAGQYNISDDYILRNFYDAVVFKKQPLCSAKDGLHSIAALEASRIACETGKTVFLNTVAGLFKNA